MTRKLYLLLIGAVVSGVLVAACGGGSSTSSTSSTPSTTSSASTGAAATTSSSSTPTSTTSSSSTTTSSKTAATSSTKSTTSSAAATTPSGSNQAVVAICKAEIQKLATAVLTSDEKVQLNHLCDVAGSGNTAQIKAAEKQICLTVIKDSAAGLSGPALTAAQQSCNRVGQTPTG